MGFNLDKHREERRSYELVIGGVTWKLPYMQNMPLEVVDSLAQRDEALERIREAMRSKKAPASSDVKLMGDAMMAVFEVTPGLREALEAAHTSPQEVAEIIADWQSESATTMGEPQPYSENGAPTESGSTS